MITKEYYDQWINIDACTNCALSCHKCDRNKPTWVKGENISFDTFEKICKDFKNIAFRGTYGDAIYHPHFHKLLEIALSNDCNIELSTNGHGKTDEWWEKTFELASQFDTFRFIFAIDGLPEESEMYRRGQDGEAVFEKMKLGASKGLDIRWQFIVFSYNEDSIDEAKELAAAHNIKFNLFKSSRWQVNDPYKPTKMFLPNEQRPREVHKLYPKCMSGGLPPAYTIYGDLMPCSVLKVKDTPMNMKLGDFKDCKGIIESEQWSNFFDTLLNDPQNAPAKCKEFCGTQWNFKEIESNG